MSPWDLFDPTRYNPLDPTTLTRALDPQQLLAAAAAFPGGAMALVFALFWAPVGPGIPAGVLLARRAGLNPVLTLGLYALSDVLGACVCHPIYSGLRRMALRSPRLRAAGARMLKLALIGTPPGLLERLRDGSRGMAPVLFRIGTVGFGVDVYTAGLLVAGLPIPRVAGWLAAIAGDLVWFSVLLATSMATAQVTSSEGVNLVVMIVAMAVLPRVARRFVPALREA